MAPSIFINGCALSHLPATARSGSKTLRHSVSTLTHALKHLAAAESNATITHTKRVNQTCTEVVLRWSEQRIWNLETQSPTGGKIRGQNPGYGFGTWKRSHPRVTHLNRKEDPQTQALFRKKEKEKRKKEKEKKKKRKKRKVQEKNNNKNKKKNKNMKNKRPQRGTRHVPEGFPKSSFILRFSRLPGGLGHLAESGRRPKNATTTFHPIQIAKIRLISLLFLALVLVLQFRLSLIDEV